MICAHFLPSIPSVYHPCHSPRDCGIELRPFLHMLRPSRSSSRQGRRSVHPPPRRKRLAGEVTWRGRLGRPAPKRQAHGAGPPTLAQACGQNEPLRLSRDLKNAAVATRTSGDSQGCSCGVFRHTANRILAHPPKENLLKGADISVFVEFEGGFLVPRLT